MVIPAATTVAAANTKEFFMTRKDEKDRLSKPGYIAVYRGIDTFIGPEDAFWTKTWDECFDFIRKHPEAESLTVARHPEVPVSVFSDYTPMIFNRGAMHEGVSACHLMIRPGEKSWAAFYRKHPDIGVAYHRDLSGAISLLEERAKNTRMIEPGRRTKSGEQAARGERAFIATYRGEKVFTGPPEARWLRTREECSRFVAKHPEKDKLRVEMHDNVPPSVIDPGIYPFKHHGSGAPGAGEPNVGEPIRIVARHDPHSGAWVACCDAYPDAGWCCATHPTAAKRMILRRLEELKGDKFGVTSIDFEDEDDLDEGEPIGVDRAGDRTGYLRAESEKLEETIHEISDLAVNMIRSDNRSVRLWAEKLFGILDYDIDETCAEYDWLQNDRM